MDQAVTIANVTIPTERFMPARGVRRLLRESATYIPFAVAGVVAGQLGSAYINGGLLLATLPVTIFLSLLVHELGHLTAARAQGFIIYVFAIGPLCLVRRDGRWCLTRAGKRGAGGFVVASPREMDGYRRRRAVVVAAGSLANIAFGLLLAALADSFRPASPLDSLLMTLAVVSLFTGFVQITPYRFGALCSDGATLLRLLRGGEQASLYELTAAINGRVLAGERPRDWDRRLIESITQAPEPAHRDPAGFYYAFLHYFDCRDNTRAEECFERALSLALTQPAAIAAHYLAALACCYAYRREHLDGCRDVLELIRRCGLKPDALGRLEAAVALAEGDYENGQQHARAELGRLDQSWLTGLALLERECLETLLAEPSEQPLLSPTADESAALLQLKAA